MKRYLPVLLLLALLLIVGVAVAGDGDNTDAIPQDCPIGQFLCLIPGEGGYIWCDGGVLEIHPDEDDPGMYIVFCEYGQFMPLLPQRTR